MHLNVYPDKFCLFHLQTCESVILQYQNPFTCTTEWFLIPVHVLRPDGTEADCNELGRIVCKLPLPPGTMSTLYKAPGRFLQVYFSKYSVSMSFFLIGF